MFTAPKCTLLWLQLGVRMQSRAVFSYFTVSGSEYRKILSLSKKQHVLKSSVFTANITLETVTKKAKLEHLG